MFIYILNLLYDGLKKKNNNDEHLNFEIINDTRYISQLAGIKKNFDFTNITDKIIEICGVLNKYNLTRQDSIGILNKLMKNKNNLWILESFNYGKNDTKEKSEQIISLIIKSAFEKNNLIQLHEYNLFEEIRIMGYEISN